MDIIFSRSSLNMLPKYIVLHHDCFPTFADPSHQYLTWLYEKNPIGMAVGVDALHGEDVVGQVIAIPGEYNLRGRVVKGLLAVNGAVHPKFRGRFLFKKLGLKLCEFGANDGYTFVTGVANAAATPSWIRRVGFQLVEPLRAMIGFGSLGIKSYDKVSSSSELSHSWTSATMDWRSQNPKNNVKLKADLAVGVIKAFASSSMRGISAYAEIPYDDRAIDLRQETKNFPIFPRVFLGLVTGYKFGVNYFNIPTRLKPSPLNLINKNLINSSDRIDSGSSFINFLDFDAF